METQMEKTLSILDDDPDFSCIDSVSTQVRNEMIHAAPASSLLNYLVRSLVDESLTQCVIRSIPSWSDNACDREKQFIRRIPIDVSSLSETALSRILCVPDDFDTFQKREVQTYAILHADEILALLWEGRMVHRKNDYHTARIISFVSQTGEPRVAIMKTTDKENPHLKGTRRLKKTSISVFASQDSAIDSQNHAIDSIDLHIKLCKGIRAELLNLSQTRRNSKEDLIERLWVIIDDLSTMNGYNVTRILRNLNSLMSVLQKETSWQWNFAFQHAESQLNDFMLKLIRQQSEIRDTLQMIETFDQLQ